MLTYHLAACAEIPPPGREYLLERRGQVAGVADDIAYIIDKAPEYIEKAVKIVKKAEPYIDDIVKIVEDPALPGLIQRIRVIRAFKAAKPSAIVGTLPLSGEPSIDTSFLAKYLPAVDAYIWVEQNKWVIPVGIAAAVLIPGAIGYLIGNWRGKKAAKAVR